MNKKDQFIFETIDYLKENNESLFASFKGLAEMRVELEKNIAEMKTNLQGMTEMWTLSHNKPDMEKPFMQMQNALNLMQRDLSKIAQDLNAIPEKLEKFLEGGAAKERDLELAVAALDRKLQTMFDELLKKVNEIREATPDPHPGPRTFQF
jgi:chaperonin cofactor prefoldin